MRKLKDLKNLGNTIIANLNKIGIYTVEDLKKSGAIDVYKKITNRHPDKTWPVCYYLYSIEGALNNKHWNDIGESKKRELLKAINKL